VASISPKHLFDSLYYAMPFQLNINDIFGISVFWGHWMCLFGKTILCWWIICFDWKI